MPRINRIDVGNLVYHVINRSNARLQIFYTKNDYRLFEKVLEQAKEKYNMRIFTYCIMPNHWHLCLRPRNDGDLSIFMKWLSMTHTQRWHVAHDSVGSGHLYQGRYKSFIVETNKYLLQLFRYIERNPLRANLVKKAESWQWSSLWRREQGSQKQQELLSDWPIKIPDYYLDFINTPQTDNEIEALRYSVNRSKPFGSDDWVEKMIDKFNLNQTLHNPGRPVKGS